jgi:hypothetical protein
LVTCSFCKMTRLKLGASLMVAVLLATLKRTTIDA